MTTERVGVDQPRIARRHRGHLAAEGIEPFWVGDERARTAWVADVIVRSTIANAVLALDDALDD